MPDAAQLRQQAAYLFATALATKDQSLLERLCIRAGQYLDQANTLEAAQPPVADAKKKE